MLANVSVILIRVLVDSSEPDRIKLEGSCTLSSEKAMAPHSSTLAWKIPWREESGRLQSMGSLRVRHDWSDLAAAAAHSHSTPPTLIPPHPCPDTPVLMQAFSPSLLPTTGVLSQGDFCWSLAVQPNPAVLLNTAISVQDTALVTFKALQAKDKTSFLKYLPASSRYTTVLITAPSLTALIWSTLIQPLYQFHVLDPEPTAWSLLFDLGPIICILYLHIWSLLSSQLVCCSCSGFPGLLPEGRYNSRSGGWPTHGTHYPPFSLKRKFRDASLKAAPWRFP